MDVNIPTHHIESMVVREPSPSTSLPTWNDAGQVPNATEQLPEDSSQSEPEIDQLEEEAASGSTRVGITRSSSSAADIEFVIGKQAIRCTRCEKSNTECIAGPRVSCARCRTMHQSCSLVNKNEPDASGRVVEDEMLKLAGHTDKPHKLNALRRQSPLTMSRPAEKRGLLAHSVSCFSLSF